MLPGLLYNGAKVFRDREYLIINVFKNIPLAAFIWMWGNRVLYFLCQIMVFNLSLLYCGAALLLESSVVWSSKTKVSFILLIYLLVLYGFSSERRIFSSSICLSFISLSRILSFHSWFVIFTVWNHDKIWNIFPNFIGCIVCILSFGALSFKIVIPYIFTIVSKSSEVT